MSRIINIPDAVNKYAEKIIKQQSTGSDLFKALTIVLAKKQTWMLIKFLMYSQ
jgi:hypothetical protein